MPAGVKIAADVHAISLFKSSSLSEIYVPHIIKPEDVIRVLNAAKISFTLVGAHGLGGWMQKPRATEDVDVVVMIRHVRKAVAALTAAYPNLEAADMPVVVRLKDRASGSVAIDVMKPNQPVIHAALKNTRAVQNGRLKYKIPSLEMALALKFAPMVSLYRDDLDKFQDAHDFGHIARNNPDIDLDKLAELGELVYPGGGAEVVEMVRRVRAGEKLNL